MSKQYRFELFPVMERRVARAVGVTPASVKRVWTYRTNDGQRVIRVGKFRFGGGRVGKVGPLPGHAYAVRAGIERPGKVRWNFLCDSWEAELTPKGRAIVWLMEQFLECTTLEEVDSVEIPDVGKWLAFGGGL